MVGNLTSSENVPPYQAAFYIKWPSAPKAVETQGALLLNWTWSNWSSDSGSCMYPELLIITVNVCLLHSEFFSSRHL